MLCLCVLPSRRWGWHLLRVGKIQQAAPLTRGRRASTRAEGPKGVAQTEEGWGIIARQESLVHTCTL